MRTSQTTIILFLLSSVLYGQNLKICRADNGLIGYCDDQGQVVIKHQFIEGLPFIDGHAAVRVQETWGIIDENANWIVIPSYDEVYNCENVPNHILVKEDDKWYFCNEYGVKYTRGYRVGSPWYEFEIDGYHARFTEDTWFSVIHRGKWGVININDEVKIPFDYQWLRVIRTIEDGKEIPVSLIIKKNGKYAWQRLDAQAATGFDFDRFLGMYDDLLFFKVHKNTIILNSTTGERYSKAARNHYGLINEKDSVGLVNAWGQVVVPFKYEIVNLNKVPDHVVFGSQSKLGLGDLKRNVLLEPLYKDIFELGTFPPSIAVRNQNNLIGIFLIDGIEINQITPFKYSFANYENGVINIGVNNKHGTVTLDGTETWR